MRPPRSSTAHCRLSRSLRPEVTSPASASARVPVPFCEQCTVRVCVCVRAFVYVCAGYHHHHHHCRSAHHTTANRQPQPTNSHTQTQSSGGGSDGEYRVVVMLLRALLIARCAQLVDFLEGRDRARVRFSSAQFARARILFHPHTDQTCTKQRERLLPCHHHQKGRIHARAHARTSARIQATRTWP